MKKILLLILLITASVGLKAQVKDVVKGVVNDDAGQPLPGVNIVARYNSDIIAGCASDTEGNYEIEVPDSLKQFTLEFIFLGYEKKEIMINRTNDKASKDE